MFYMCVYKQRAHAGCCGDEASEVWKQRGSGRKEEQRGGLMDEEKEKVKDQRVGWRQLIGCRKSSFKRLETFSKLKGHQSEESTAALHWQLCGK